jgi:arylsulfatase A-like enzyme
MLVAAARLRGAIVAGRVLGHVALLAMVPATSACGARLERPSRVVLVTLDTTRADRLGCYGHEGARTPHLDRLASEGFLFLQALTPVPMTLPSHSTMLTGLYPPATGVRYNTNFKLGDQHRTLAEVFREAGYEAAAFLGAFPLARPFGLDQGFAVYDAPEIGEPGAQDDEKDALTERTAAEVIQRALPWVERQPPGARYLLWVHLWDPHWPYAPPFPFAGEFRDRPYDGEIAYMDSQLGRLLDALRAKPGWDETLVVVVGDHGEGLHDHRERFHSLLAYDSTLRVPLIVKVPGTRGGRRIEEPVSLVDLFPTLVDLCDLPRGGRPSQGTSLRPAFEGRPLPQRELYFEALTGSIVHGWSPVEGVRLGSWKLIEAAGTELFDIARDPGEENDLAGQEPDLVADLRQGLESIIASITPGGEGQADSESPEFDEETLARLASLGYIAGPASVDRAKQGPDPRKLVYLEGELHMLQGAVASQEWEQALEMATYVLKADPTSRFALYIRALALRHLERDPEALEAVHVLLEHYRDSPGFHELKGEIYVAMGRPREGAEAFAAGRVEFPRSEGLGYKETLARFQAGEGRKACHEVLPAVLAAVGERLGRLLVLEARCRLVDGRGLEAALEALGRAVRAGFRDLATLREIRDFREVVQDPRFRELEASLPGRR